MSQETDTVAARIDAELKADLERAAEECDRSMSAYLEAALERHAERNPYDLSALGPGPASRTDEPLTETERRSATALVDRVIADQQ